MMAVVCGVIAAIFFVLFLIWELTDDHPVVDLKVFRHKGFAASMAPEKLDAAIRMARGNDLTARVGGQFDRAATSRVQGSVCTVPATSTSTS